MSEYQSLDLMFDSSGVEVHMNIPAFFGLLGLGNEASY